MKLELLIIDANVLIDFCKTERSILTLVAAHVGVLHVPAPVLDEVKDLDRQAAEALGLRIVEIDLATLTKAANASVGSALALQDWLCLHAAEEHGWTCVTNDKRLRAECDSRNVQVMWGLQLLLRLVEQRTLSVDDAVALAQAIHQINRRISKDVIASFIVRAKAVL